MKRFALAAVVLVLVSVSMALAQRDAVPEGKPAGVLSELKAGQWISMDISKERIAISVIKPVDGEESVAGYRKRLQQRRQARQDVYEQARVEFEKANNAIHDDPLDRNRRKDLEAATKRLNSAQQELGDSIPNPDRFWEVAEVEPGFFRAANSEQVVCIPEASIRYVSKEAE